MRENLLKEFITERVALREFNHLFQLHWYFSTMHVFTSTRNGTCLPFNMITFTILLPSGTVSTRALPTLLLPLTLSDLLCKEISVMSHKVCQEKRINAFVILYEHNLVDEISLSRKLQGKRYYKGNYLALYAYSIVHSSSQTCMLLTFNTYLY